MEEEEDEEDVDWDVEEEPSSHSKRLCQKPLAQITPGIPPAKARTKKIENFISIFIPFFRTGTTDSHLS